jgi:NAD(P)-dependent dehydrogenase (short-subunit alcohol dehydrogenase family)
MTKLQGKVAVVTGGAAGIGFATAKRFVDEGAFVFITGRRQKELGEAVKAIGGNVVGVQGDVSKLQNLDRLYETVKAKGKIDVLVANAGVGEFAPLASLTEEHFDKLFDLNVKGTLFTVQKALTLMNDGGSIILIGSVASVKGTPAFGAYGATKAAVRNLVRAWTVELTDRRIRSNVLSPSPIKTPLVDRQPQKPLRGSWPPFRWDAWVSRTKSPRQRCSWPQTIPALSRASSYSSMAAEVKFDQQKRRTVMAPRDASIDCQSAHKTAPDRRPKLTL